VTRRTPPRANGGGLHAVEAPPPESSYRVAGRGLVALIAIVCAWALLGVLLIAGAFAAHAVIDVLEVGWNLWPLQV
jgi:hypothetical protein